MRTISAYCFLYVLGSATVIDWETCGVNYIAEEIAWYFGGRVSKQYFSFDWIIRCFIKQKNTCILHNCIVIVDAIVNDGYSYNG